MREKFFKHLTDKAKVRQTILHLEKKGILSAQKAREILEQLDQNISQVEHSLFHLSVLLGFSLLRFSFMPLPPGFGSLIRSGWVALNRLYHELKRSPQRSVHSLGVFLFAMVPAVGCFAYLLAIKKKSAYLAYVYAEHVAALKSQKSFLELVVAWPALLQWLVAKTLLPADIQVHLSKPTR